MRPVRAALAAALLVVCSMSAVPTEAGAPATDADRLGLGFAEGPYLEPGPVSWSGPYVRWDVLDPRGLPNGRLAMTVRVTAPPVDLPVQPGPAMLVANLSLYGDAGGDVGLQYTFPELARVALRGCDVPASCTYQGRIVLRADRIGPYVHKPVQGRWLAVTVGLTLLRTFDQGHWIQVLPLWRDEESLDMAVGGTLDDPRPFRGVSAPTGLVSRDQLLRWDRQDEYRRDRLGLLGIVEQARKHVGDPSARTPSVPVRLSLDPSDCPRGMTLSSAGGAIAFDRATGGDVNRTVELPVGSTWTLTVPSLDHIDIPAEDTLLTFGPFTVGTSAARILGAWGCVGIPQGDVQCTGCTGTPTPTPVPTWPPGIDPVGPLPLGQTPSTPVGMAWQQVSLPGDGADIVDIAARGGGFVALAAGDRYDPSPRQAARIWTSDTGQVWRRTGAPFPGVAWARASLERIVSLGDRLVAVGHDAERQMAWSSTDGTTWQRANGPSLDPTPGARPAIRPGLVIDGVAVAAEGGSMLVLAHAPRGVAGTVRRVWTSDDGQRWTAIAPTGLGLGSITDLAAGPDGYIATRCCTDEAGTAHELLASEDGTEWEVITQLPAGADRVVWATTIGRYVAAGHMPMPGGREAAAVWTSPDGVRWDLSVHGLAAPLIDMTLLVTGSTIVLATPGFDGSMGWTWWSALVSTDGGMTWDVSAGSPVQGEVLCPAVGAVGRTAMVLTGCGRTSMAVAALRTETATP